MNSSNDQTTSSRTVRRRGLEKSVREAVQNFDLTADPTWQDLQALSQNTEFDGMEVFESSIVQSDGNLIAPGTVYVVLNYKDGGEVVTFRDAYPLRVFFVEQGDAVTVDHVEVDTSSFYN